MEPKKFTAEDLRRWIPSEWLKTAGGVKFSHISENVYSYSIAQNEDFAQTLNRLEDTKTLFLNLPRRQLKDYRHSNTNDDTEFFPRDVWVHRIDLYEEFSQSGYDPSAFLYPGYVAHIAASMVERPWLDSHFMEWVIVDSLVCNEVREFGRSIIEEELGTSLHKGMNDVLKVQLRVKLITRAARFVLL